MGVDTMPGDTIYLDYNATTPIEERVLAAMMPYLRENFGNPSSGHAYGRVNKGAIVRARSQVAGLLGCDTGEVVFTSGGSEANNYAIKGAARANRHKGTHIITSVVEHPAVINPCRYLEQEGFRITYLPVDEYGMVNVSDVEAAVTKETILITVMHANNEVGTIQPIPAISEIARNRGIVLHTDAAQSVGKVPVNVDKLGVDLLTVAGHKFYGPKGVGALYIRNGTAVEPLIHGAGHEDGRRAGTENVAYIVALGEACELAAAALPESAARLTRLRDKLHRMFTESADDVILNGHPEERLPNTLNLSFKDVFGADVLTGLPQIAASTGSACHDGTGELSGVLKAMGVDPAYGFGSIRFSLGRDTTENDVKYAAGLVADKVRELRGRK